MWAPRPSVSGCVIPEHPGRDRAEGIQRNTWLGTAEEKCLEQEHGGMAGRSFDRPSGG